MYLSIWSYEDSGKNQLSMNKSIYECDRILINQNSDGIILTCESNGTNEAINIAINGKIRRNIYIMNNDGKTIEHITWNGLKNKNN